MNPDDWIMTIATIGLVVSLIWGWKISSRWKDPLDDSIQRRMKQILKSTSSSAKR